MIVYDVRDADAWPPDAGFVEAYGDWLTAHGIDKNLTYRVEHHDAALKPFVRVHQFAVNTEGNIYLVEATGAPAKREPYDVPTMTPVPRSADFTPAADHG
jgi:hypothetical protein